MGVISSKVYEVLLLELMNMGWGRKGQGAGQMSFLKELDAKFCC